MQVSSSTIQTVEYAKSEKVLVVTFVSGAVYRYENVTRRDRDALVKADSIGRHFNKVFKAKYTGQRVEA